MTTVQNIYCLPSKSHLERNEDDDRDGYHFCMNIFHLIWYAFCMSLEHVSYAQVQDQLKLWLIDRNNLINGINLNMMSNHICYQKFYDSMTPLIS